MFKKLALIAAVVAVSSVASANLTFKAGVGYVDPTGDSDINSAFRTAEVSGEAAIMPSFDYRFGNSPFSAELLLASPMKHSLTANNGTEIARFKQLPPTLTFKYNTPEFKGFSANVGLGATVLVPFEEELVGLAGTLETETVVAPAAQIGVAYQLPSQQSGFFADVRYADMSTDVTVNGVKTGELEVNPLVYTVGFSHKF